MGTYPNQNLPTDFAEEPNEEGEVRSLHSFSGLHFQSDGICEMFGGTGHSCSPCQWREKDGELRAILSHRIGNTTGVSWLLIAEVAAGGGETVAFGIEEARGDVEAVRLIH